MAEMLRFDLNKQKFGNPVVYGRVADGNEYKKSVQILMDGQPFDLTGWNVVFEGATNFFKYRIIDESGVVITDAVKGQFDYTFPNKAFSSSGYYERAYFAFEQGDKRLTTTNFEFVVLENADITAKDAETYLSKYNNLIENSREILESMDPGGAILSEIFDARGSYPKLKDRINSLGKFDVNISAAVNEINRNLVRKVDKGGNEQVTFGMLSQDVKEAMTGGSVAVVGVDSVNTSNYVDGSVTPEKTSFVKKGRTNVLNTDSLAVGKSWRRTYSANPTIKQDDVANMGAFDPISLKKGVIYTTTYLRTTFSYFLDGTWDKETGVYTGNYYVMRDYLNVEEFAETTFTLDKDMLFFPTSATINPDGSPVDLSKTMVVEGDSLPDKFLEYNEYEYLEIENLRITDLKKGNIIRVEKDGTGDYSTIQDAIDNADENTTIMIGVGEYREAVSELDKNLTLIGVSRDKVVLYNDSNSYGDPPLEIAKGYVSNMTIYAKKNEGTIKPETGYTPYGVHIDWLNSKNQTLTFDNCVLKSDWNAGAGIGLRGGFKVTFRNCEFITTDETNTNGALFFHDSNHSSAYGRGDIELINCDLRSASAIAVMPSSSGVTTDNNSVYMRWVRSTIYSDINKSGNSAIGVGRPIQGDGWRDYNNFYLSGDSWGNNNSLFNNY